MIVAAQIGGVKQGSLAGEVQIEFGNKAVIAVGNISRRVIVGILGGEIIRVGLSAYNYLPI